MNLKKELKKERHLFPILLGLLFLLVCPISLASSSPSEQLKATPPSFESLPHFTFPEINYSDIITADKSSALQLSHVLTTLGFLQIYNIPSYENSRIDAISHLNECMVKDDPNTHLTSMADGSTRNTVIAPSKNGKRQSIVNTCVERKAAKLRALVDTITTQIFQMLDLVSVEKLTNVMSPYKSYEDIVKNGEHLEHFHVYEPASEDSEHDKSAITMRLHTDHGIMIAMTPALYEVSSSGLSEAAGLYVELPNGSLCKGIFRDDSLVIMIGQGAQWLSPVLGASLRPVPHAMIAGFSEDTTSKNTQLQMHRSEPIQRQTRSWYGKMILPPLDATIALDSSSNTLISYEKYRMKAIESLTAAESLPAACGDHSYKTLLAGDPQLCTAKDGTEGVLCWMQCVSVADTSLYPCGTDAVCVDTVTNSVIPGDVTCPEASNKDCQLQCVEDIPQYDFSGYCYGSGVSMYMDGFNSMIFSESGTLPCVNMLFTSWTLDSRLKFGFACIGAFLGSLAVPFMTSMRQKLKRGSTKVKVAFSTMTTVTLYGVQVVMSYFLMLVAMTYNVELFTMVCAGLTVGYALFNMDQPPQSVEPCCDIDIDSDDGKGSSGYNTLPESSTRSVN